MPRIIFIKDNGKRIFVECDSVPMPGAGPGTLQISNVEIKTHHPVDGSDPYNYIHFPSGALDPGEPVNPDDLAITLQGPLHENHMILPFNGGPSPPPNEPNEITVKITK